MTTRTRIPGKYEGIRGTNGEARYGKLNPLLYEFAEIVRAIRERWSADPAIKLSPVSRFIYAWCGTATFFGYLFLIRGLEFSEQMTARFSPPLGHSQSVAAFILGIDPYMVTFLFFTLFFATLLTMISKPRGRIMLYLEGVALPAATMALILFSLGGGGSAP